MKTRLFLTSLFLIAVCLAWLVLFTQVLLHGVISIQESNPIRLFGELVLFYALIGFAVSNLITM